jgi:hypothetical protein
MKSNRSCTVGISIGIAILCLVSVAMAEDPYEVAWITQFGTPAYDVSLAVATDGSGNAYISGYTLGDLAGPNAGSYDAFLTKFDTSGNPVWSQQIGTTGSDYSQSVTVDASGNVYISGYTMGDIGGTNSGLHDAFLTKFDASGSVVWSQQIGTAGNDTSQSVAVDTSGNVYITGNTYGDLARANSGSSDAFLTKFDTSGNELWSRQIGTTTGDGSTSAAIDASGNVYISGYTSGDVGGINSGDTDAFLTKFDTSGNELWSQQIGSADSDGSSAVAVDAAGNVYITGWTEGDLHGDNAGDCDGFLSKFDVSGNELWRQQFGTSVRDSSESIAIDAFGSVFVSGYTKGDIGGPNAGDYDAFLTKFDSLGNELWSQQFGTESLEVAWADVSRAVALNATGDVYISGSLNDNDGGPADGITDAFLIKYTIPEPATMSLLALGAVALLKRGRQS